MPKKKRRSKDDRRVKRLEAQIAKLHADLNGARKKILAGENAMERDIKKEIGLGKKLDAALKRRIAYEKIKLAALRKVTKSTAATLKHKILQIKITTSKQKQRELQKRLRELGKLIEAG